MEIGSEFWIDNDYIVDPSEQFYMSGRSALSAIISDIKQQYCVQQVLLPSYCCDSLIMPFVENEITVRFYDVYLDSDQKISVSIPSAEKNEVLFLMHFFGAKVRNININGQLSDWIAIIEDQTHSFFSNLDFGVKPDYSFVSFRKWFGVTGIAMAKSRYTVLNKPEKTNYEYISLRNKAFDEKLRFIRGEFLDKEDFLSKFKQAEEILDDDCSCALPDIKDFYRLQNNITNKDVIVEARRKNALLLIKALDNIEQLSVIVNFDFENDCPLFVPIVELTGRRNELRNHLISHQIYCPVHWPLSSYHKGLGERVMCIYDNELSLVCDQRYAVDDMNRTINCIQQFYADN